MPDLDRSTPPAASVDVLMARVQELCDAVRSCDPATLATYVEANFLGDATAIVSAAIRADPSLSARLTATAADPGGGGQAPAAGPDPTTR